MKNKFVIVTHAVLSEAEDIAGPAHTIVSYLNKKEAEVLFIRHSLFGNGVTLITNKNKINLRIDPGFRYNEIFQRLIEGFRTIRIFFSVFKNQKPVYIGVDPLNSIWGVILKKMGRIKILITFTVDYSDKRYKNAIMNSLYHFIDRMTVKNSDYLWSVSKRILDLRLRQGVKKNKLFYIPNSPPFSQIKPLVKKNPNQHKLVTISTISKAVDFVIVLDAISELKKEMKIRLTIIGAGPGLENLKKEVKKRELSKEIVFLGPKTHEEVFEILSRHGIGIALYTDEAPWSFYSDSMKARDYLALGLPVVISGDIGTAHEINEKRAGIVIKRKKEELVAALKKLIEDKNYFNSLRKNALELAEKNDVEKILNLVFEKIEA